MSAGAVALKKTAIAVLAPYGRLSTITAPRQGSTQLSVDILDLYRKQISLIGCNTAGESQQAINALLKELVAGFEDGSLKAPDEKEFTVLPLDRALEAYEGKAKKAVIVMD